MKSMNVWRIGFYAPEYIQMDSPDEANLFNGFKATDDNTDVYFTCYVLPSK
jgi:hypothetical protein